MLKSTLHNGNRHCDEQHEWTMAKTLISRFGIALETENAGNHVDLAKIEFAANTGCKVLKNLQISFVNFSFITTSLELLVFHHFPAFHSCKQ